MIAPLLDIHRVPGDLVESLIDLKASLETLRASVAGQERTIALQGCVVRNLVTELRVLDKENTRLRARISQLEARP